MRQQGVSVTQLRDTRLDSMQCDSMQDMRSTCHLFALLLPLLLLLLLVVALLLLLLLLLFPASSAEPADFWIYPDLAVDASNCTVHGNTSTKKPPCLVVNWNVSYHICASCEDCFRSEFICNRGGRNQGKLFYCPTNNGTHPRDFQRGCHMCLRNLNMPLHMKHYAVLVVAIIWTL
jgi:hypothetical protein